MERLIHTLKRLELSREEILEEIRTRKNPNARHWMSLESYTDSELREAANIMFPLAKAS